jgi:hypothetical protein
MIVKPVHHHLVTDLNIDPSLWHILLNLEETGSTLSFKSKEKAAKVSQICCSVLSSIGGFHW